MKACCGDIYKFIDSFAPFDISMDFDNCGLLVGSMNDSVNKAILTLDITPDVIEEAKNIGADLIISHHPVIFKPLKRLSSDSCVYMLAKNGINALCAHTNLDMANKYGVNSCLAQALGLKNTQPLNIEKKKRYKKIVVFIPEGSEDKVIDAMCEKGAGRLGEYSKCSFLTRGEGRFCPEEGANPYIGKVGEVERVLEIRAELICPNEKLKSVINAMINSHPYEKPAYDIFDEDDENISIEFSCGLIGKLEYTMNSEEFAKLVKEKLSCEGLRYTKTSGVIKKVAVCSGAGGDYLNFAIDKGCDAFVTGEIKHHMILTANSYDVSVIDAGHFKTEDIVFNTLKTMLEKEFPSIQFVKTSVFTDHIKYI